MKRRTFAQSLALLALPVPARAQPGPTIRIAEIAIDLYAEAYYAQELGLFKKAGFTADISTFANGGTASTAVAGGAADLGVSNPVAIASAVTHGVPLTVLAGAGLYSTNAASTALCVAKSSPLRTAKDVEGKTIALSALHDQAQIGVQEWLQKNGADPSKVQFVEIPFPEMGNALQQGRVDVAMIPEPALTIAQKTTSRLFAKPFDAIAPQFLIGVWFTTTAWVQKNPDLAKKFAGAIYDAGRWANGHRNESAVILAKYSKIDPATLREMTRAVYATTLTPQMIQPPLDAAAKYGLLSRPVTASELIAKL
ncbi:MAG TPA: ABC transporter substrate-binding protein [Candidatus Acidoferrales bacterium]|jgi:ABC-type nitrate/sulfonate/bicarbonate transport system substrate-binding protein|nr:ABC transporter substrate-binding protein [Candidatus Acidoferrales bacterium]